MIFLTIFLLIFTYLFLSIWLRRRTLPPGPIPLPLLGNMHQLAFKMLVKKKDFAESIRDFVKEYGSVHTFWFGPLATVHICDYPNAADAMIRKGASFSNRELPYLFDLSRKGRGILAANDTHWLEQRRFALHTLKNFGLGRNIMEERIMFEFDITNIIVFGTFDMQSAEWGGGGRCEALEKQMEDDSLSINPNHTFDLLIANIINRMLFTDRFEKKDEEEFFALKAKLDNLFDDFELYDLLLNKWTMRIPFLRQRVDAMLKPQNDIVRFLQNQVDRRKKEIADGSHTFEGNGEDFVDAFLIQIEKEKESNSTTSFDETTLAMTLLDLWTAGQETTATTLVWAFAYLLLHPQVHKQFRRIFILAEPEIQRCASIFPMNLWRRTEEDTHVGGYMVPKGTAVTAQLSLIMSDDVYFKNSAEFDPDRYLKGDDIEHHVIPFGIGKRACLGEALAKAELYLIIGNFLLRYGISADSNHMPTMVPQSVMETDSDKSPAPTQKTGVATAELEERYPGSTFVVAEAPDSPSVKPRQRKSSPLTTPIKRLVQINCDEAGRVVRMIEDEPYYHGFMSREETEKIIKKEVRKTEVAGRHHFVITLMDQGNMKHFLIKRTSKKRLYWVNEFAFKTINDLIQYHLRNHEPLSPTGDVFLEKPCPKKEWQLNPEQIEPQVKIGEGAFGEVYKGLLQDGIWGARIPVAIKTLHSTNMTADDRIKFLQEANIMREFRHPSMVSKINYVYGAARGMAYLQTKEIIHRLFLIRFRILVPAESTADAGYFFDCLADGPKIVALGSS
ncbi:SH2 domain protein [Ancylostoma ceylanicum]|uniref:Tyrosine-protein kinase n=1 Tax=Ancylostoma ceylanicum TaxID=53326 RepID=A0A0D6MAB3_9BILA|nr:SH2 domain protein [Ancylostoma ceylanicum]